MPQAPRARTGDRGRPIGRTAATGPCRPRRRDASRAMIHDVDESLRTLVRREALNGSKVEIGFEAPTREWSSRQNTPTVSLYLYDIREDVRGARSRGKPSAVRMASRPPPPATPTLPAVVSHHLLDATSRGRASAAVRDALLLPALPGPARGRPGRLAAGAPYLPLTTTIALPPPADRSIADVWSALGGELKPSLDLVVTAPLDATVPITAAPPVARAARHPGGATGRLLGRGERVGLAVGACRHVVRCRPSDPCRPARDGHGARPRAARRSGAPGASRKGKAKGKAGARSLPRHRRPRSCPGRRLIIRGVRRP